MGNQDFRVWGRTCRYRTICLVRNSGALSEAEDHGGRLLPPALCVNQMSPSSHRQAIRKPRASPVQARCMGGALLFPSYSLRILFVFSSCFPVVPSAAPLSPWLVLTVLEIGRASCREK